MAAIFAECRRVLKPDGILTLMFTHKATGAWDALTKGLIEQGFVITASWPINTEAEGSLHIKDKAAANSTIFLVCRPRADSRSGSAGPGEPSDAGQKDADRLLERIALSHTPLDSVDRGGYEQSQDAAPTPLQVQEAPGVYTSTPQDTPDLYWEDVEPRGRARRAGAGRRVPGRGHRGGRSLSRLLRAGARRVLPPLAAQAGYAARAVGGAPSPTTTGVA